MWQFNKYSQILPQGVIKINFVFRILTCPKNIECGLAMCHCVSEFHSDSIFHLFLKNRIKYRRINFQVSSIQDQVDRLHPEWAKNISLEYREEG